MFSGLDWLPAGIVEGEYYSVCPLCGALVYDGKRSEHEQFHDIIDCILIAHPRIKERLLKSGLRVEAGSVAMSIMGGGV